MPKRIAAATLLLMAFVLGACGEGEDRPGGAGSASGSGSGSGSGTHAEGTTLATFPPAEAEVTIDVTMKDFEFVMPATIKPGKVLFKLKNDGPTEHDFIILQGTKELAHVEAMAAGKTGELAVVLPAGRYTAACHIGSGGGRHDKLGMVENFTVG